MKCLILCGKYFPCDTVTKFCSILGEMEDMRMFEESQEDDEENPHEISLEVLSIC